MFWEAIWYRDVYLFCWNPCCMLQVYCHVPHILIWILFLHFDMYGAIHGQMYGYMFVCLITSQPLVLFFIPFPLLIFYFFFVSPSPHSTLPMLCFLVVSDPHVYFMSTFYTLCFSSQVSALKFDWSAVLVNLYLCELKKKNFATSTVVDRVKWENISV